MFKKTVKIVMVFVLVMVCFTASAGAKDLTARIDKLDRLGSYWSIKVKLLDGITHKPLDDSYTVAISGETQQVRNDGFIELSNDEDSYYSQTLTIQNLPDGAWCSLIPCVRKESRRDEPTDDSTIFGGCFKTKNCSGTSDNASISVSDFLYLKHGFFTPVIKEYNAQDGQEVSYTMEQTAGETCDFDESPVISYGNGSVAMPTVTFPESVKNGNSLQTISFRIIGKTDGKTVSDITFKLRMLPNPSEKYSIYPAIESNLTVEGVKTLNGGELEGNDFEFELIDKNPIGVSDAPLLIEGPAFRGIISPFMQSATSVVFTDETPTDIESAKDVSYNGDRSVLAWLDGDSSTVKVSSLISGEKIRAVSCKSMFKEFEKLKSVDGANLDTSMVRDMSSMFQRDSSLTEVKGIKEWNTEKVLSAEALFSKCDSLKTVPEFEDGAFSSCLNMNSIFYRCYALTDLFGLSEWNVSSVTNMNRMFYDCKKLADLSGLSEWNVSSVADMSEMFYDCYALADLSRLSEWNVSSVTSMSEMFLKCGVTDLSGLSEWNVSSVTDMSGMFFYCSDMTDLSGLSEWDVSSVIDMSEMFYNCKKLADLSGLSEWNVSSVIDMSEMFSYCNELANLSGLSEWNVSSVTDMSGMFDHCYSMKVLDLSKWKPGSGSGEKCAITTMFYNCSSLTTIYAPDWYPEFVSDDKNVFMDCSNLKGEISYSSSKKGGLYCKNQDGYFTPPRSYDETSPPDLSVLNLSSDISSSEKQMLGSEDQKLSGIDSAVVRNESSEPSEILSFPEDKLFRRQTSLLDRGLPFRTANPIAALALTMESQSDVEKNSKDGTIKFRTLSFDVSGVYTYEIKEKEDPSKDFVFDKTVYTLTVTVGEDEDGWPYVVSQELTGKESEDNIKFENTVTDKARFAPKVKKTVIPPDKDVPSEFYRFKIEQTSSDRQAEMPESNEISVNGSGEGTFEDIVFSEEGEYQFRITEIGGSTKGMDYDKTVYTLIVEIATGENGLEVESTRYEPEK